MGDDVNMGTEFEGIKIGTKVVSLDETCSEWKKAKEMGRSYLMVMAVRHEPSGDVYAVTADEKKRLGITVAWISEEKLVPYEDKAWEELFQECNRLRLLLKIDQALDEKDGAAFLGLTEELKKAGK